MADITPAYLLMCYLVGVFVVNAVAVAQDATALLEDEEGNE